MQLLTLNASSQTHDTALIKDSTTHGIPHIAQSISTVISSGPSPDAAANMDLDSNCCYIYSPRHRSSACSLISLTHASEVLMLIVTLMRFDGSLARASPAL